MIDFTSLDFHTHNLMARPGTAIVNLPEEALLCPESFSLQKGGLYSVGIHPWWTTDNMEVLWQGFEHWAVDPQIVAIGECGLDKLRGAEMEVQQLIFRRQLSLAEELGLPATIHCVKAFDRLLAIRKDMKPSVMWTVHGFRGKPELARQLLAAGFCLSFGIRHNAESLAITPADRCYRESDEDYVKEERSL